MCFMNKHRGHVSIGAALIRMQKLSLKSHGIATIFSVATAEL